MPVTISSGMPTRKAAISPTDVLTSVTITTNVKVATGRSVRAMTSRNASCRAALAHDALTPCRERLRRS